MKPATIGQRNARREGSAAGRASMSIEDCPYPAGAPKEHQWKTGHKRARRIECPSLGVSEPPKPLEIDGVEYPSRNAAERKLGWTAVREHLRGVTA